MKAVLTIKDRQELLTMLGRKPIIIKLPKRKDIHIRNKFVFIIVISLLALSVGISGYQFGIDKGIKVGYSTGHQAGYNEAVNEILQNKDLTLTEALAWNLRLHLDKYVAWFGVVIGLAWVFHGVGFHLVKL